uniref:FAD-binding domain-containing protein n=1 Tax=Bionectria ochroleuca TaxID=29856 RepID=A0A8H7KBM4_BIOOC
MEDKPILIIGAGISGLVLAQYLRKEKICFRIFERDSDLVTRGVGWGLTLNWSLPALRSLLPEDLVLRLPETYVDRASVQAGAISTFPFLDLSTGDRKFQTPKAPESQRIRVTRQKLRALLAKGINIEWGKSLSKFDQDQDSVTATFEDGSSATGRLLIACNEANSRARRQLSPIHSEMHRMPVCLMGMKLELGQEKAQLIRNLDPFFL